MLSITNLIYFLTFKRIRLADLHGRRFLKILFPNRAFHHYITLAWIALKSHMESLILNACRVPPYESILLSLMRLYFRHWDFCFVRGEAVRALIKRVVGETGADPVVPEGKRFTASRSCRFPTRPDGTSIQI